MTRQCGYHNMGHRKSAIGGCALESLTEGGSNLDADIGQLLGLGICHEYHLSLLVYYTHEGGLPPPTSPLNRNASSYGQQNKIPHLLESMSLSPGLL